ncbi:hypothetical protein HPP92_020558 [Vanilla planifolia]|uniref:Uncharacterized protein n=1 Tax=Vanilla planifolia TaxID=51239 RepID=A0A835Q3A5_VANPL|nr:hypothetical protein HPP92_020959 [Vanilla planifolia]KAG0462082.1 hypothetical protein HPP92_020558 [Vanilla planifolia]
MASIKLKTIQSLTNLLNIIRRNPSKHGTEIDRGKDSKQMEEVVSKRGEDGYEAENGSVQVSAEKGFYRVRIHTDLMLRSVRRGAWEPLQESIHVV